MIESDDLYDIETLYEDGSTNTELSVANVTNATQGRYECEAVYEDGGLSGRVMSEPAVLTVYST